MATARLFGGERSSTATLSVFTPFRTGENRARLRRDDRSGVSERWTNAADCAAHPVHMLTGTAQCASAVDMATRRADNFATLTVSPPWTHTCSLRPAPTEVPPVVVATENVRLL